MAQARRIENLDCRADAAGGARLVLLTRAVEMIDLRARALDFSDPEGVHDMRVASRRLRSALRDFRSLLARRDVLRLNRESKRFADALGAVRDEDVAIMRLEKLAPDAPADVAPGLAALTADRAAVRDEARRELTAALAPDLVAELAREFAERLAAGEAPEEDADEQTSRRRGAGKRSSRSFRGYGRRRIRKQFARLREHAASLYDPLDAEPLHQLRIEAKRLRYALELFGVCWEGRLAPVAEQVAELQGALGELHDCDVWVDDLRDRLLASHDLEDEAEATTDGGPEARKLAYLWLLDTFAKERTKHYRRALALWSEWERAGLGAQLDSVLTNGDADSTGGDGQPAA